MAVGREGEGAKEVGMGEDLVGVVTVGGGEVEREGGLKGETLVVAMEGDAGGEMGVA